MEKCGEPKYVDVRVFLYEFPQTLHRKSMSLGLPYVKGDLVFHIFPVIDDRIVHMHRIPHDISQEADRIIMERDALDDDFVRGFFPAPVCDRNHLSGAAVDHFPPAGDIIPCIRSQHVRIEPFHQRDA